MPYTIPSLYAPGTIDLLTLMRDAKNGSAGLKRVLHPDVQTTQQDLGDGASPGAPGDAAGTGTAASAAVGNGVIGAIGNSVMGAVLGPLGMMAATVMGIAPPSAVSVAVTAAQNAVANSNAVSAEPDAEGISAATQDSDPGVNGSVADGDGASASSSSGDGASSASGDYAKGGIIRGKGTSTSDSIPINASNGEYMLPAHVVEAIGKPFLDHLISSIPNVLGGN